MKAPRAAPQRARVAPLEGADTYACGCELKKEDEKAGEASIRKYAKRIR